jgi:hypothetical protein
MKVTGTISRSDLEGGHWLLKTDKGDTYQLEGAPATIATIKDGMRVEVEGKIEKDRMGIGMTGPHFAVKKLTAI